MSSVETQAAAWEELKERLDYWAHEPDLDIVRAILAGVSALDLDQPCCWLMVVGPPSTFKTEYIHFATAYKNHVFTSEITSPGLISMQGKTRGEGILKRLGVKGLWLIKDFGSIVGLRDEIRSSILAAMREVYDGRWERSMGGHTESWSGQLNVIAAATPAVERAHRVVADLGDRFVQIRVKRPKGGDGLGNKAAKQAGKRHIMRREFIEAGAAVLSKRSTPVLPPEWTSQVLALAEFVALARAPAYRNYNLDLVDISPAEGAGRLFQEFLALGMGDAANHGLEAPGMAQTALLRRVAYDTLPTHRGNILRCLEPNVEQRRATIVELTGEWSQTVERAAEELEAVGMITRASSKEGGSFYKLTDEVTQIVHRFQLPAENVSC